MENVTAIILAAGSGSRMHTDIPKQFLEVNERPIISYS
ncbi:MAG: 2-C-methyl-D-erythritol 4-phosphate cytidylyltransferase, partial [Lachnospiraceae bacterium]|nr:2-C-methyl-D-erythritol 4-phosphate cytidylyltransferase [Lachnospiraceae bacterium]